LCQLIYHRWHHVPTHCAVHRLQQHQGRQLGQFDQTTCKTFVDVSKQDCPWHYNNLTVSTSRSLSYYPVPSLRAHRRHTRGTQLAYQAQYSSSCLSHGSSCLCKHPEHKRNIPHARTVQVHCTPPQSVRCPHDTRKRSLYAIHKTRQAWLLRPLHQVLRQPMP
jgi:hypothetical protein